MAESSKGSFRIGYALLPKKQQSFMQVSLVNHAKARGVDLIKIDTDNELINQGPFDCVLHKIYGDNWKCQLSEYQSKYPNVVIIDSPEATERLHNRITMLQAMSELKIEQIGTDLVGIPKKIVIYDAGTLRDRTSWETLKFPVVVKPLVADGSAKSHKMYLVYNQKVLTTAPTPPIVLQEFFNHGGVIFKVYVAGEHVRCVKRKSLPDVPEDKLDGMGDVLTFSQISNLGGPSEQTDDRYYKKMKLDDTEMPPEMVINEIAKGLRESLKLNLFNFDVIRDMRVGNRYLVIDINYFPGYSKLPSYETVVTDFFCDLTAAKKDREMDELLHCSEKLSDFISGSDESQ